MSGSLPRPPATALGPYTGFAASNLALPQAVIGGVSLLIVRTRFVRVQVPVRSCGSCGTDTAGGGVGAFPLPVPRWPPGAPTWPSASDDTRSTAIARKVEFR